MCTKENICLVFNPKQTVFLFGSFWQIIPDQLWFSRNKTWNISVLALEGFYRIDRTRYYPISFPFFQCSLLSCHIVLPVYPISLLPSLPSLPLNSYLLSLNFLGFFSILFFISTQTILLKSLLLGITVSPSIFRTNDSSLLYILTRSVFGIENWFLQLFLKYCLVCCSDWIWGKLWEAVWSFLSQHHTRNYSYIIWKKSSK